MLYLYMRLYIHVYNIHIHKVHSQTLLKRPIPRPDIQKHRMACNWRGQSHVQIYKCKCCTTLGKTNFNPKGDLLMCIFCQFSKHGLWLPECRLRTHGRTSWWLRLQSE